MPHDCFVLCPNSLAISQTGIRDGHRSCKSQKLQRCRCAKPHRRQTLAQGVSREATPSLLSVSWISSLGPELGSFLDASRIQHYSLLVPPCPEHRLSIQGNILIFLFRRTSAKWPKAKALKFTCDSGQLGGQNKRVPKQTKTKMPSKTELKKLAILIPIRFDTPLGFAEQRMDRTKLRDLERQVPIASKPSPKATMLTLRMGTQPCVGLNKGPQTSRRCTFGCKNLQETSLFNSKTAFIWGVVARRC